MERKNEKKINNLSIGVLLLIAGIVGMFLIFFLLSIPSMIIFLFSFYPFLTAFIFGLIYLLSGLNKISFSRSKIIMTTIIIIGAFIMTIGLDILVPFVVRIL